MTDAEKALLLAFELHSPEQMQAQIDAGLDLRQTIEGKAPLTWLTEMYTRSDRLSACVRLLLQHGAAPDDPAVIPVLLNDAAVLTEALRADPTLVHHRTTMTSAFTPLGGATLLHVAAEYGQLEAARVLLAHGADVNGTAATDDAGLNGHTPLFHTVNSNANRSAPVMELLLTAGARVDVRLEGIVWGRDFPWETTCFDVTPVSYAQLGLLPPMHRDEAHIYANIRRLLQAAGRPVPPLNVPNRYLAGETT